MNMKMKTLSLALVGLAGFGFAGAAAAGGGCPGSPVPPWSSVAQFQGSATIVAGGLDGTACRLNSTLNAGAGSFASATVFTDSPSAEPRYRAQFIMNVDALSAPGFADAVQIFSATSTSYPLRIGMFGNGTSWFLSYVLGSSVSGSIPLAAGENTVEIDLEIGATGSLSVWVNNGVEGTPSAGPISVDSSAMVGIEGAYVGLTAGSGPFVINYGGTPVQFDQFDSRRSTFIGTTP